MLVLFDLVYIDLGGYMSLADTQYLGIIENILERYCVSARLIYPPKSMYNTSNNTNLISYNI